MKLYIEIETTDDRLCMYTFDEVIRRLKSAASPLDSISDKPERLVFCQEAVTQERFGGGVVTATLMNKLSECGCDNLERASYWNY